MTSVSTIEDIFRAMRDRPEVRDAVRREVLVGRYWWKQLDKKRGSRPRCVLFMDSTREETADRLTRLVDLPDVSVSPNDTWMPYGKPVLLPNGSWNRKPAEEARLDKADRLLPPEVRQELACWWLAVARGANTPNWDIASTCTIEGKKGLVLVEAKAHANELDTEGKSEKGNEKNHERIGQAIDEANRALRSATSCKGWNLSRDSHYQLSNRSAWAWKLASLGVPVVLLYLGFLNAEDMDDDSTCIFRSEAEWERTLKDHCKGIVPEACWGKRLDTAGTPMIPIIRAFQQPFT